MNVIATEPRSMKECTLLPAQPGRMNMHFSFSGGLKSIERIIFLWASSCFRQAQEVIVLAKILAAEVNYGYEVFGKSGFSAPTHEKVVESHLFPMIFIASAPKFNPK